jgi:hypothetical protein
VDKLSLFAFGCVMVPLVWILASSLQLLFEASRSARTRA